MVIPFNKYQGTGNDFIIIDNRASLFDPADTGTVRRLCDRRFGIGADGLILVSVDNEFDFRMSYFNSDGFESTMCGNGGRCTARFAHSSGIAAKEMEFRAIDGIHRAIADEAYVTLQMNNVSGVRMINGSLFLNTGSPHYVVFSHDIDNIDVFSRGKKIRWSGEFAPGGTNVDFVELSGDGIYVRTFERGVEDETLSCGTGVTASAIAAVMAGHFDKSPVNVRTKGGDLNVKFEISGMEAGNIWLTGPATFVYYGEIAI